MTNKEWAAKHPLYSNLEYLRLGNAILKAYPSSPRQKELQAKQDRLAKKLLAGLPRTNPSMNRRPMIRRVAGPKRSIAVRRSSLINRGRQGFRRAMGKLIRNEEFHHGSTRLRHPAPL